MIRNLKTYQLAYNRTLSRHTHAEIMIGGQCCYEKPSKLLTIETKDVLVEVQLSDDDVQRLIDRLQESLKWATNGA